MEMTAKRTECADDPVFALYEANLAFIRSRTWTSDRLAMLANAAARLAEASTEQLSRYLGDGDSWKRFEEALAMMRVALDIMSGADIDRMETVSASMRETIVSHIESVMKEDADGQK